MIDIVVIAGLIWLLVVHCMLRLSYSKRRRKLDAVLDFLYADPPMPSGTPADDFPEADLLRLSGQTGVNAAHASHAIAINVMCIGALVLLFALNYAYGMPPAGWMSALLLPAPTCMLLWHMHGRLSWSIRRRAPDIVRGMVASIRWPISVVSIALIPILVVPVVLITGHMANREIPPANMADAGVGIFTVISGLIVIIAGGIALRLLYIDKEYGERVRAIDQGRDNAAGIYDQTVRLDDGRPTGKSTGDVHGTGVSSLSDTYRELADIGGKREANGRGILVDGICMALICVVGFATALEYGPGPAVSAVVSFTCFLCAIVPLHYHIRNALRQNSESFPL